MRVIAAAKRVPGIAAIARAVWRWVRHFAAAIRWRVQDLLYGIDTYVAGGFGPPVFIDDAGYEPLSYRSLRLLHEALGPHRQGEVVFDIGCGKGRTICFFARCPVKKCVGIERVPYYAAAARENANRVRGRSAPVEIWETDATVADYSEATLVILFNPFGPETMQRFLAQIRRSLDASPRCIQIVYVNALHEEPFHASPWLRCMDVIFLPYKKNWPMKVSIWESPLGSFPAQGFERSPGVLADTD
jgi:precorrin-6B methylase 2